MKAVVFDMDGLMFDTERVAILAWDYAGEKMGLGKAGYMVYKTLGVNVEASNQIWIEEFGDRYSVEELWKYTREFNRDFYANNKVPVKKGLYVLLDYLKDNGFTRYEVSNFAKKGFESKHNTVYWRVENYLGCGAGATGTVDYFRWNNVCDVEKYIDFWLDFKNNDIIIPTEIENLSESEKEFEFLMMGFRLREGVKSSDYKKRFGGDLASRLGYSKTAKNLENPGHFDKWMQKNLADVEILSNSEDLRFFLTSSGIMFLNQFLEELM